MPKVVIMYLVWSDEPQKYLTRVLEAVSAQSYSKENLGLLIVYNSHKLTEESAAPYIKMQIAKYSNILPHTTLLEQNENFGFSKGNNLGMKWAIDAGFDYVFLHNADGYLEKNCIANLVSTMESDKSIGQSQPLIILYPEINLINSAGNVLNYLGIGYCSLFRQQVGKEKLPEISEIGYASGAATMLRSDLLLKYGLWNEIFFLYHEDSEYSKRLEIKGFKIVMDSRAIFFHQYEFSKSKSKFYWLERNRHVMNLLLYKWPTLVLLFPLELIYNLTLFFVALTGGWAGEIFKVYVYWSSVKNWQIWLRERQKFQADRVVSDRQFLRKSSPVVTSGDLVINSKIFNKLANLIFTFYYYLLRILVRW